MSLYQGGKKRIGKRIFKVISLIEKELKNRQLSYFEPFCGMCGVLRHFATTNRRIEACDINKDLILLLKAVQKGKWKPPTSCSKKCWEKYRDSKKHSATRGFIGIAASWGGIFFQGYRLNYTKERNFLKEASNNLKKLSKEIKKVKFLDSRPYDKFTPKGKLIYCDPPYKGNLLGNPKGFFRSFNHDKFWGKMRRWSKNNIVVISESSSPRDFIKIWSTQSHVNNSDRYTTKKYPDNLYIHKTLHKKLSNKLKRSLKNI